MKSVEMWNRNSFSVEAVQVTADNMEEVAHWADGYVLMGTRLVIDEKLKEVTKDCVIVSYNDGSRVREGKVYEGDWILLMDDQIAVYNDENFRKDYQKRSDLLDAVKAQVFSSTVAASIMNLFEG